MPSYQANTNVAHEQGGDALLYGANTPSGLRVEYRGLSLTTAGGRSSVGFYTDFLGDTVDATLALNGTGSVAISSPTTYGGVGVASTSTTNNEFETIALGLHWRADVGGLYAEARIANVSAIATRVLEFGFSDALSETNGLAFSSHDATPVAVATDATVFGYNTGDTMTSWSCLAVKNGTAQVSVLSNTYAPVAGTYQVLGVAIDSAGNAQYFINGVLVATLTNAITATVPLTLWFTVKTLSSATKSVNLDYIGATGNRY